MTGAPHWTPTQVIEVLVRAASGYHEGLEAYIDAGWTEKPGGVVIATVSLTSTDKNTVEYFNITVARSEELGSHWRV